MEFSFDEYLQHFGKFYTSSEEYERRKRLFLNKLKEILAHNKDKTKSWKKGLNELTDMSDAEIKQKKKGRIGTPALIPPQKFIKIKSELPSTVDWRTKDVVTPVKNQGSCGCCWSEAATECIESQLAINTGSLLILSPQEFIDCAQNPDSCGGTGGCQGATAEIAYATAIKYGAFLESEFPFQGKNGNCTNTPSPVANVSGWVRLPRNDYDALMQAVATIGPIAISVDASWTDYESGVFPASEGGTDIDHAVQLVGYGYDNTSKLSYWLVRNSWGTSWGEDGYIRLERNASGLPCGTDTDNQDGVGCASDPTNVTVCGTSAILYDSSYPTGVYLL
eukprot:CAMPEP_0197294770 /NCGR_PEP_ID=MMETSP0890-20130614/33528_1 /TAXON_ID=44058 ORGANISM="Aureoumbra lagunensis, Strain CCMP1510" /NCGR_SAMPLE_ID=MMETSP0890 /ASSEMBLY_ACC=CAM_ASM_000533 /LENGTH=334 /DNA_ID=CAMNT_0042770361 /DNA_START=247 /DNA_END=1251 /DNA_ORIENTATION=+